MRQVKKLHLLTLILLSTVCVLNAFDYITTDIFLQLGVKESNPIAQSWSLQQMLLAKTLTLSFLILATVLNLIYGHAVVMILLLIPLTGIYLDAISNNIQTIKILQKKAS